MALVRCPQCGRVAEPGICFACGHEWDDSAPAPTPEAPVQAAPSPEPAPAPPPEPVAPPAPEPAPAPALADAAVDMDVDMDVEMDVDMDVSIDDGPANPFGDAVIAPPAPAPDAANLFAKPAAADPFAAPPPSDPFGAAPAPKPTEPDPFGMPPAPAADVADPFGAAPAAAPAEPDPFGAPPAPAGDADPFGAPPPPADAADPFGAPPAPAADVDHFGAPPAPAGDYDLDVDDDAALPPADPVSGIDLDVGNAGPPRADSDLFTTGVTGDLREVLQGIDVPSAAAAPTPSPAPTSDMDAQLAAFIADTPAAPEPPSPSMMGDPIVDEPPAAVVGQALDDVDDIDDIDFGLESPPLPPPPETDASDLGADLDALETEFSLPPDSGLDSSGLDTGDLAAIAGDIDLGADVDLAEDGPTIPAPKTPPPIPDDDDILAGDDFALPDDEPLPSLDPPEAAAPHSRDAAMTGALPDPYAAAQGANAPVGGDDFDPFGAEAPSEDDFNPFATGAAEPVSPPPAAASADDFDPFGAEPPAAPPAAAGFDPFSGGGDPVSEGAQELSADDFGGAPAADFDPFSEPSDDFDPFGMDAGPPAGPPPAGFTEDNFDSPTVVGPGLDSATVVAQVPADLAKLTMAAAQGGANKEQAEELQAKLASLAEQLKGQGDSEQADLLSQVQSWMRDRMEK